MEHIINPRLPGADTYFDAQPVPHATLDDLDLELVRAHMQRAKIELPRFQAPSEPIEFLTSRHCLRDDAPTLAGLLIFGRQPQELLSYAGVSLTHFYGPIVTTQVRHSDTLEGTCKLRLSNGSWQLLVIRRHTAPAAVTGRASHGQTLFV